MVKLLSCVSSISVVICIEMICTVNIKLLPFREVTPQAMNEAHNLFCGILMGVRVKVLDLNSYPNLEMRGDNTAGFHIR